MCLAVPGRIESIEPAGELLRTGRVNFGGIVKTVNLGYVPEAQIGDYVIVHAGIALNRIDEEEAKKVFEYLEQLEEPGEMESDG